MGRRGFASGACEVKPETAPLASPTLIVKVAARAVGSAWAPGIGLRAPDLGVGGGLGASPAGDGLLRQGPVMVC